jgi:hypothetical protein
VGCELCASERWSNLASTPAIQIVNVSLPPDYDKRKASYMAVHRTSCFSLPCLLIFNVALLDSLVQLHTQSHGLSLRSLLQCLLCRQAILRGYACTLASVRIYAAITGHTPLVCMAWQLRGEPLRYCGGSWRLWY